MSELGPNCWPLLIKEELCFIIFQTNDLSTNSEDTDQIPCSVASDLGPHCLSVSNKKIAKLKWIDFKKKQFNLIKLTSPFPILGMFGVILNCFEVLFICFVNKQQRS